MVIWVTPDPYFQEGNDFPIGPTPEDAKLETDKDYLVLNIEYDERYDEAVVLVVNDYGEIWSLSNRHLRVSKVYKDDSLIYSLSLKAF